MCQIMKVKSKDITNVIAGYSLCRTRGRQKDMIKEKHLHR